MLFINVVQQGCQNKCGNGTLKLEDESRMGFGHKLKLVHVQIVMGIPINSPPPIANQIFWKTHQFLADNCLRSMYVPFYFSRNRKRS